MEILKNELTSLWEVTCPKCYGIILNKNGKYRGRQRFVCLNCGISFTTYSKGLLNSTKLDEPTWHLLIDGILENKKIKDISELTGVSVPSISKIRRRILDLFWAISSFQKILEKYYFDPKDKNTIFADKLVKKIMYYYHYNETSVIAVIHYHDSVYISRAYTSKEFEELQSSIHYPTVMFLDVNETDNIDVQLHIDKLVHYLKQFRGIKSNLLSQYCNFYDFSVHIKKEEMFSILIKEIPTYIIINKKEKNSKGVKRITP